MNVGGVVKLADVSDFISPSQACVLPLPKAQTENESLVKLRSRTHRMEEDKIPKNKVTVTLNDCLACSGCVTTAETVLIQSQTISEFMNGLSQSIVSVVTVSPQALSSLAEELHVEIHVMGMVLARYLKSKGAKYVIDSSFGRYFALKASLEEFQNVSVSAQRMLIAGVCPGFVCYAEKKQGNDLVPLISKVRSPQAITGALVKGYLCRKMGWKPEQLFHATLMPCYDKKLEASRTDFVVNGTAIRETDCVVTPSELLPFLKDVTFSIKHTGDSPTRTWLTSIEDGLIIGDVDGESSGGYAAFLAEHFIADMNFRGELDRVDTERHNDLEKITVHAVDGRSTTFVKAYGFKNIQNLVRGIKQKRLKADYVEVMACPKGCVNGGGQVREKESVLQEKRVRAVDEIYSRASSRHIWEQAFEEIWLDWQSTDPRFAEQLTAEIRKVEAPPPNSIAALAW